MKRILAAAAFAAAKHTNQRRGRGSVPYINHPIRVAQLVADAGGNEAAVCAALLHDVMEDCEVQDEEVLNLFADPEFGQQVLAIVKELTDDKNLDYAAKKARQACLMESGYSPEARMDRLADQTSNMEDLVADPPLWTADGSEERQYIGQMKQLADAARGKTGLTLESAFGAAYEAACKFYGMAAVK